jgi:hypothetical protein
VDHIDCLAVIVYQKHDFDYAITNASPHDLPFLSSRFTQPPRAKLATNDRFDFLDCATMLGCMFKVPGVPSKSGHLNIV